MKNEWGIFAKLLIASSGVGVAMLSLFWTVFINPIHTDIDSLKNYKADRVEVEKKLAKDVFNVVVTNINDDIIEIKADQKEIKGDVKKILIKLDGGDE
jgi:hypothetical protein